MTGDISSNTQLLGSTKMNRETTEQTDALETIITELTKLNELNYTGYSIDTMSKFVYEENVGEISSFLQELVHKTDGNIRLHLIIS
jgi:uncharacterized protein YggL (DUF469 family)